MRYASHQAAQRGHLFGMDQLLLGGLEIFVGTPQRLIGATQLTHRAAGNDQAHHLADTVVARRAVERDWYRTAVGRLELHLHIFHGVAALVGEQASGMLTRLLVGEQIEYCPSM